MGKFSPNAAALPFVFILFVQLSRLTGKKTLLKAKKETLQSYDEAIVAIL